MTNEDVIVHQLWVSRITEAFLALDSCTADDGEVNYKALYYALFNDLSDAIDELERGGCDAAKSLIRAQQRSEARFLLTE